MSLPASLEALIAAQLESLSLNDDPATVEFVQQIADEDSFEPEVCTASTTLPCPSRPTHTSNCRTRRVRSWASSNSTRPMVRSPPRTAPALPPRRADHSSRPRAEDLSNAIGELLDKAKDFRDQEAAKAQAEEEEKLAAKPGPHSPPLFWGHCPS